VVYNLYKLTGMSIGEIVKKGKNLMNSIGFGPLVRGVIFIALVILLGYGIERLVSERGLNTPVQLKNSSLEGLYKGGGQLVASRTGSKYHLPWCSGAQSIKEANKVWFSSKEEAERAGYAPATNCRGILEE
jgi:hypothetical protein